MIEQAHETARLIAYAERLEAETRAMRTLNDAMAMVCERLLNEPDRAALGETN